MAKFYYGWGSVGCLYDGIHGPYEDLEEAAIGAGEVAEILGDNLCDDCFYEMVKTLSKDLAFVNDGACDRENAFGDECGRGRGFDYVELFESEEED